MPSLEDIRQFNTRLITLGDEPEVVREWGEQVEDVAVPESAVDDELSSLLSDDDADGVDAGTDDLFADDVSEPPDFDSLLSEEPDARTDAGASPDGLEADGFDDLGDVDFGDVDFGDAGPDDLGPDDASLGADATTEPQTESAEPEFDAALFDTPDEGTESDADLGAADAGFDATDFDAADVGTDATDLDPAAFDTADSTESDFDAAGFESADLGAASLGADEFDSPDFEADAGFGAADLGGSDDLDGADGGTDAIDLDTAAFDAPDSSEPDFDAGGFGAADLDATDRSDADDLDAASFDADGFDSPDFEADAGFDAADLGGSDDLGEAPVADDSRAGATDSADEFGDLAFDDVSSESEDGDAFGDLDAVDDGFGDLSFDEPELGEPETGLPADGESDELDELNSGEDFAALLADEPATADADDDLDGGFDLSDEPFGLGDDTPDASDDDLFGDDAFSADDAISAPADDEFTLDDDDFALPEEEGFSLDDEMPSDDLSMDADDFSGFDLSTDEAGVESTADDQSFAAPSVPGEEDFSVPSFDADDDGGDDLGADALGDVGDLEAVDTDDLDEFSLGDFGAEFGVLDDAGPSDEDLNPAIDISASEIDVPMAEAAPGSFSLSDDEFTRLQRGLAALPLNLKQNVEEIVAEAKGTTDDVEKLCRMLVEGESAAQIATFAGKILGTRIRIPRGYEKSSGEDFERERSSFAYQFRENIWPIVRLVGVFGVIAAIVGLLGYNFIARPLIARNLYQEGVDLILADQYSIGNQTFDRAWDVWENPEWFYTYADAFSERRQYSLAVEKYQQLVFGRDESLRELALESLAAEDYAPIYFWHDPPKRGILAYAELESRILGDYRAADQLYSLLIFSDTNDYEGRIGRGDNFMRWGEDDPTRFEDARLSYARLIEQYGQTDELLFRMLGYFIAVDNLEQVLVLKETFQADSRARINPEVYGDLAGYLIDKEMTEDVEDILFRALEIDDRMPELHYELSRLYREINARGSEDLALDAAIRLLSDAQPFGPDRRAKLIDTHTRVGENHYDAGRFLEAQESFTEAIDLYDQGRARRVLGEDPTLARVYSHLGDIFYYIARDFPGALRQFDRAEENGFESSDLDYKQGFVHYRNAELEDALDEFREAADDPSAYTNALIWATANTYFRRSNYFASEALYRELLDRVELDRDRIRTLLLDEDSDHRSIIEYLFRGYNNLGVTLFELSEQTGDAGRYSESLVFFTESTELAENYLRDQDTLVRSQAVDLAFLNQREALFPRPEFEMQIYNAIPEDLDDPLF